MAYMLHVSKGSSSSDIITPSPEIIDQAIGELLPVKLHFVILNSETPVNSCLYIQTIIEDDTSEEVTYYVETRFEYDNNKFKQYAINLENIDCVKKIFRMFALGETPDISGWEDVTQELMKAVANQTKEV